ncbi:MAG: hypothetical protein JNM40_15305 [Myxococcales bacterium]|nr:hypothetical protein [Myxococcales bacterium]
MVYAHLSLARPALLGFVRAYLWQLERTGALTTAQEAEQQAAQEAAEALYAAASDRDQRSRLFVEFRQLVEQHIATPSPALQAVIARLVPASPSEPIALETQASSEAVPSAEPVASVAIAASVEDVAEVASVTSASVDDVASVESVPHAEPVAAASLLSDDVPLVERSGELPAPHDSADAGTDELTEASAEGDESARSEEAVAADVAVRTSRRRRERR